MKNKLFNIIFDSTTGCITEISNLSDKYKMNWCSSLKQWGKINIGDRISSQKPEYHDSFLKELSLSSFTESEDNSRSVYENDRYLITVDRFFRSNGNFVERYTVKNITDTVLCLCRDNFAVAVPFNDAYPAADICMTNYCNTHIWCSGNSSWVNALKMGKSDINLGLVLTKGALASYSQYECKGDYRGYFELETDTVFLKSRDEYMLEWELFWHTGKDDFFEQLTRYNSYIGIKAEHFTVFGDETINFEIYPNNGLIPEVFVDEHRVDTTALKCSFGVSYTPERTGEHKFKIQCGSTVTYAVFNVKISLKELIEKRIDFIVSRQQCLDKESPLYGAYLVYDNDCERQFFDFYITDHNACRERMNMPLAVIKYLQHHKNEKAEKSIKLYMDFLFREFYDETTGEVFNNIGKRRDALRLYNSPGVMLIFTEMYYYSHDERYLDNILKLAEKYYSIGGEKCYSNAVAVKKTINAFLTAKRYADADKMKGFFKLHTDTMINNGTAYPPHEVNYEQTIVTPAVNCISQYGLFTQEKGKYTESARLHMECLERFMGNQPSYHLNEISLRYWDDLWFGKARKCGDTLPHHLSCLSARAFAAFAELSGEEIYLKRAEEAVRNCFCLISDNARGSAAYVFPNTVNGSKGEFFDLRANDQDLIIYDIFDINDIRGSLDL